MTIKTLFKKIFSRKSPAQAQMDYLISQGITIGKNLRLNSEYAFDATYPWLITVGDNVCISTNVKILTHDTSTEYTNGYTKIGPVTIGDNVYLGHGVTVLCGVTIGNNSIIGAGSVVPKNIPDNVVAAGNPAKIICTIAEYKAKHEANLKAHPVYDGPCLAWHQKSTSEKLKMKNELNSNFGYMK